ncbi:hypothetical protein ACFLQJ_02715 [Calditrichota bacterium]
MDIMGNQQYEQDIIDNISKNITNIYNFHNNDIIRFLINEKVEYDKLLGCDEYGNAVALKRKPYYISATYDENNPNEAHFLFYYLKAQQGDRESAINLLQTILLYLHRSE